MGLSNMCPAACLDAHVVKGWQCVARRRAPWHAAVCKGIRAPLAVRAAASAASGGQVEPAILEEEVFVMGEQQKKKVVVVGGGWAGELEQMVEFAAFVCRCAILILLLIVHYLSLCLVSLRAA
jgi:hypothetical protein